MKLNYTILLLSLISLNAFSQTWQWGKRGGGPAQINEGGGTREQTLSIVTDSEKNTYTLSVAGGSTINVDGQTYAGHDFNSQIGDVALSSFSCDGTHRWTKIIGSNNYDHFKSIKIDDQGNIYLSGYFGSASGPLYPQRIGTDHMFPTNPTDESKIITMKFSGDGELLWFRKLQPLGISSADAIPSGVLGFDVEGDGTTHLLALLTPGVYAGGAFTATLAGTNYYIVKYGTAGNFISSTYLDMQFPGSTAATLEFYRNKYNGNYYFTGSKPIQQQATVGGQLLTNSAYMFSFSQSGGFLWKRENTSGISGTLSFYNLDFDSSNNIYIGGRMIGISADSFLGYTIAYSGAPSFVIKTNPTADGNIWGSHSNANLPNDLGGIVLNGNELALTSAGYGTAFTWGSQSVNVNQSGTDVLLARLDTNTGTCLSLASIQSSSNSNDYGTSIAVDASGDYIVGGTFEGTLNLGNSTLVNIGSQTDFFVAKFASSLCSPLSTVEFGNNRPKVYPNPARDILNIVTDEPSSFTIYNLSGQMIKKGRLDAGENIIDIRNISGGLYLLKLENRNISSYKIYIE